jgi:hypothetical protein
MLEAGPGTPPPPPAKAPGTPGCEAGPPAPWQSTGFRPGRNSPGFTRGPGVPVRDRRDTGG